MITSQKFKLICLSVLSNPVVVVLHRCESHVEISLVFGFISNKTYFQ